MPSKVRCAAALLHLGLENVSPTIHQLGSNALFDGSDRGVVKTFELLDDLERPTPIEHIPSDDLRFKQLGQLAVPGLAEHGRSVAHLKVKVADHLMKVVQPSPRPLQPFQRLSRLPSRSDRRIVHARGPSVLVIDDHDSRPLKCTTLCTTLYRNTPSDLAADPRPGTSISLQSDIVPGMNPEMPTQSNAVTTACLLRHPNRPPGSERPS